MLHMTDPIIDCDVKQNNVHNYHFHSNVELNWKLIAPIVQPRNGPSVYKNVITVDENIHLIARGINARRVEISHKCNREINSLHLFKELAFRVSTSSSLTN